MSAFYERAEELAAVVRSAFADVISYASAIGVNITAGNIAAGIPWYSSEYKDRTCAEIIMEMMRLMPDHICYIDSRQAVPTFNLVQRASLPVQSYNVSAGTVLHSHSDEAMEAECVNAVIIRYEKPITVDSENYTEIVIDAAPANADGTAENTLVESVPLQGATFQSEYASVTTRTIPKESASEDTKKEWLIQQIPELNGLAKKHGMQNVRDILHVADADVPGENVVAYNRKIIDDGEARPEPMNPDLPQPLRTEDVDDYPREIIEGSLPDWAGKRFRKVHVEATIAIDEAVYEAIQSEDIKKSLGEIFNLKKTFAGKDYLTALYQGDVMGTNARTKNYRRLVTWNLGEEPPEGIAAALLAELSPVRHKGEVTLFGFEPDIRPRPACTLSLSGGHSGWSSMRELIQEASYDVQAGTTSLTYGPPEQLGATDMVERLRAARRNTYSHGMRSSEKAKNGTGGSAATPSSNWNRVGGGGSGTTQECILGDLKADAENEGKYKIVPGYISGGGSSVLLEKNNISATIGQHLYVEVPWTGVVNDGVLLSGGAMGAASIKQGASVPDDAELSASSPTGNAYIPLGAWVDNGSAQPKWQKAGCGSLGIRFCAEGGFGFWRMAAAVEEVPSGE